MDMRITKKESGINKAKESRKRIQTAKKAGQPVKTQAEKLAEDRFKRSKRAANRPRGAFKRIDE